MKFTCICSCQHQHPISVVQQVSMISTCLCTSALTHSVKLVVIFSDISCKFHWKFLPKTNFQNVPRWTLNQMVYDFVIEYLRCGEYSLSLFDLIIISQNHHYWSVVSKWSLVSILCMFRMRNTQMNILPNLMHAHSVHVKNYTCTPIFQQSWSFSEISITQFM